MKSLLFAMKTLFFLLNFDLVWLLGLLKTV